jgi:hypothetical protein
MSNIFDAAEVRTTAQPLIVQEVKLLQATV